MLFGSQLTKSEPVNKEALLTNHHNKYILTGCLPCQLLQERVSKFWVPFIRVYF